MNEHIFDPQEIPENPFFENNRVCICLPWYKSAEPRTAFSVMSLIDRKRTGVMLDFGDCFIAHSRNKLADNFLKSKFEYMLTIDDDMVVPFGNAKLYNQFTGYNLPDKFASLNAIDRLLSHGKTLVGGLYFGRWSHGKPVYAEGSESKQEDDFCRRGPHDLVKRCRWVGTGALLVHRSVFVDIEKRYPALARNSSGSNGQWFTSSEHDLVSSVEAAMNLDNVDDIKETLKKGMSMSRRMSGLGVGEDVVFAHRAAQSGHPCHVDLGLLCGHVGSYCYGPRKVIT